MACTKGENGVTVDAEGEEEEEEGDKCERSVHGYVPVCSLKWCATQPPRIAACAWPGVSLSLAPPQLKFRLPCLTGKEEIAVRS